MSVSNIVKIITATFATVVFSGCANHAVVSAPDAVGDANYSLLADRSLSYTINYHVPDGGNEVQAKRAKEHEVLIPASIENQLPKNVQVVPSGGDFMLTVDVNSVSKGGPVYFESDNVAASVITGGLSLGFVPHTYNLKSNFDVRFVLANSDGVVISDKTYHVSDSVQHEKGKFDGFPEIYKLNQALFQKHFEAALKDFLQRSAS